MRRNLDLENWLIETTGEEMMENHLGPNWKRFNEDVGFYPNISMTIADQVWQHQQSKVDELQKRVDELQYRIETSLDEIRRALNCVESTETECVLRELQQALKGEQFEEHREKAEQAISNGASLTKHRIDL